MCDLVGSEGRDCSEAMRTLNLHLFNNRASLKVLQRRFGVLDLKPEKRGVWMIAVGTDEMEQLSQGLELEKKLLRGEPFAYHLLDKNSEKPLGVDWRAACRFVTIEEAEQFHGALLSHMMEKEMEAAKDNEEKNFTVTLTMAPLARIILSDQWELVHDIMKKYDTERTVNILGGVMDKSNSERYSIRNVIANFVPDPKNVAAQFDHTVALLSDYILQSMVKLDAVNQLKQRKGAIDASQPLIDQLIGDIFSKIFVRNQHLMPPSPLSMREVVLSRKNVKAQCQMCDAEDAKQRCSQCLMAYYCSTKCQQDHWKTLRGAYYVSHKHVCGCLRMFSLVLAQLPPSITPEQFRAASERAQQAVAQFCEAVRERNEDLEKSE